MLSSERSDRSLRRAGGAAGRRCGPSCRRPDPTSAYRPSSAVRGDRSGPGTSRTRAPASERVRTAAAGPNLPGRECRSGRLAGRREPLTAATPAVGPALAGTPQGRAVAARVVPPAWAARARPVFGLAPTDPAAAAATGWGRWAAASGRAPARPGRARSARSVGDSSPSPQEAPSECPARAAAASRCSVRTDLPIRDRRWGRRRRSSSASRRAGLPAARTVSSGVPVLRGAG
jgi:hypothetical protein